MTQILIVDDDANNRAVLFDTLGDEPYDLHEAEDGPQAIEMARSSLPDLILLDIMMPGMDGISVLRNLRADERTQSIPVIIVSACGSETQVIACLEEGALDHITKPFSNAVVRARVRAALRSHPGESNDHDFKEQTIGFIGAKGGVGTTTVALNTALILQRNHKVNAVELHPSYGSFATHLGVTPSGNLSQLDLTFAIPITSEQLRPLLLQHDSGLHVLHGPQSSDGFVEISPRFAANLVLTMGRMADYTVFDFPAVPSPANLASLSHCDQVFLVLEPEVSSLAAGVAMSQQLTNACTAGNFSGVIVVRRTASSNSLTAGEIESVMDCPVLGVLLPDPDTCYASLKSGAPLVLSHSDSALSHAFREFVQKSVDNVPMASSLV
jgi:DNA-binding response OmpR family regulator